MKGICISGGGAKIGFAIGVLEIMEKKEIKPDIVYGISSGSLCTAALCFGSVQFLKDQMLQIKKKEDVLNPQWFKALLTQVTGLGNADGLYGMRTMRKKLDMLPHDISLTKGVVGYVDLNSGRIHYVSSHDTSKKEFLDAVQASCSIPLTMETQRVDSEVRVDGGVRDILPLKQIIDDPLQVDEIHVISLSPPRESPSKEPIKKKLTSVSLRALELLVNEVLISDLKMAKLYNKLLEQGADLPDKRKVTLYEYFPKETICDTIEFNAPNIRKGIEHGNKIAEEVLKDYSPVSF